MGRGVTRKDSAHVIPNFKLVCMHTMISCFMSVAPRVCLVKVPFSAIFEGPYMKTEMLYTCT